MKEYIRCRWVSVDDRDAEGGYLGSQVEIMILKADILQLVRENLPELLREIWDVQPSPEPTHL